MKAKVGRVLLDEQQKKYFYLIMGGALLFRLVLAPWYKGYYFDYGMFKYWALTGAEKLFTMYHPNVAYVDYPPVYVTVLSIIGYIANAFKIAEGTGLFLILLKLPGIVGDLVTAYIIFNLAKDRLGVNKSLIIIALIPVQPCNLV